MLLSVPEVDNEADDVSTAWRDKAGSDVGTKVCAEVQPGVLGLVYLLIWLTRTWSLGRRHRICPKVLDRESGRQTIHGDEPLDFWVGGLSRAHFDPHSCCFNHLDPVTLLSSGTSQKKYGNIVNNQSVLDREDNAVVEALITSVLFVLVPG